MVHHMEVHADDHASYQTEDDYWRIRDFLRQVTLLNRRRDAVAAGTSRGSTTGGGMS